MDFDKIFACLLGQIAHSFHTPSGYGDKLLNPSFFIFLHGAAPVIVTAVSPILFKEKLTGKQTLLYVMSTIGLVRITGIGDVGNGKDLIGILFGLGAAAFYATIVLLNKFTKNTGGINMHPKS